MVSGLKKRSQLQPWGWQGEGVPHGGLVGLYISHTSFLPFSLEVKRLALCALFSQNQGQLPKRAECLKSGWETSDVCLSVLFFTGLGVR